MRMRFRHGILALLMAAGAGCSSGESTETPGSSGSAPGTPAADACTLLSETQIGEVVGNPVVKGRNEAGATTCKWDAQNAGDVDVLLITGAPGSDREKYICPELRKTATSDPEFAGIGDTVTWKFGPVGSLFNSGDLELCSRKGFISLSLNGKRDEPVLKQAAIALARKIQER
jgi:hypothetical protein